MMAGYRPVYPTEQQPVPPNTLVEEDAALALLESAFRKTFVQTNFAQHVRGFMQMGPAIQLTIDWGSKHQWYFRVPETPQSDERICSVLWSAFRKAIIARARAEEEIASVLSRESESGLFVLSTPALWYGVYVEEVYRFLTHATLGCVITVTPVSQRVFWPLSGDEID